MKKLIPILLSLIICIFFFACPDNDPCMGKQCQNGGTPVNLNGTCECDCNGTGYEGANCETKILELGVEHEGGIIFYVDNSGEHGLIAAKTDQAVAAPWGCAGTSIPNATNSSIGTGLANTSAIVNTCTSAGIAAEIASSYSEDGKSDWYLPSQAELVELYNQRNVVGGFENTGRYWSSTENDASRAILVDFSGSLSPGPEGKGNSYRVRAIRSF